MIYVPVAIYWAFALWGLLSKRQILIGLFFLTLPLGSFAVLPPGLTGGLSFVASTMTVLLILVRQFLLSRSGLDALLANALSLRRGGLLTLFWIVAVGVTLLSPRFLAGQIDVIPMAVRPGIGIEGLRPTIQNLSQLAYLTISTFAVFAFAKMFEPPALRMVLIRGLMLAATVTIITGALDYASTYLPLAPVLAPFRTAEYALLVNVTIGDGVKRVTGLMPEASAYGGTVLFLLSYLYFLRRSVTDRRLTFQINILLAGLTLFLILSTSSAGYVGIGVFLMVAVLEWQSRASRIARSILSRRGVLQDVAMVFVGLAVFSLVVMWAPSAFDPVIQRLDSLVFNKTSSDSYIERTMWTRVAFEAGISSYMVGVGIGSVRGSNFAATLFGSVGLLGVLLYFGFVLQSLLRRADSRDPEAQAMSAALKWAFWPNFAVSLLIGTTPDFGAVMALTWGVLLALTVRPRRQEFLTQPDWAARGGDGAGAEPAVGGGR
ncbi:hypothetical protein KHC23_02075 [Ancylobacter dichloromethanicus]|uniref:Uncharacterized protein n=1 Tax=Ancylobacter dichloromethanicus TaxID=518825 RepID=A0A9W6JDV0_9HYPH|nr:hypothetical protein [Ancylobacter dichloromethanicus]MBS7552447.1 hypothetical protein [Ancylobacter dichloromethanicus]GLK74189.1 hypothetical protein GCM10017643_43070 [Ancylobacter dichloromethanicus]